MDGELCTKSKPHGKTLLKVSHYNAYHEHVRPLYNVLESSRNDPESTTAS
jgi:hypothetical protein